MKKSICTKNFPEEWKAKTEQGAIRNFTPRTLPSLDLVAHWVDCNVAQNAKLTPVKGDSICTGWQLSFEVLCFNAKGLPYWREWTSEPLPVIDRKEAEELARKLDII